MTDHLIMMIELFSSLYIQNAIKNWENISFNYLFTRILPNFLPKYYALDNYTTVPCTIQTLHDCQSWAHNNSFYYWFFNIWQMWSVMYIITFSDQCVSLRVNHVQLLVLLQFFVWKIKIQFCTCLKYIVFRFHVTWMIW